MTDAVTIANNALANIGARSSISSFSEDSPEARQVTLQYTSTLEHLLRSANWNFCKKTILGQLLKALPGTPENQTVPTDSYWHPEYPPPGYLYTYAYPSDCLRIRTVAPQLYGLTAGTPIFPVGNYAPGLGVGQYARFEVCADFDTVGNQIKVVATNQSLAMICYTFRATNPELWDPGFIDAMQDALGGNLCIPLTGNITLARALLGQANDTILKARAEDGNEGMHIQEIIPDWIRVRGTTGYALDPTFQSAYGPLFSLPSVL